MKINNTITVNNISDVCDCIKNSLEIDNHLSISIGDVSTEEKMKIKNFLEGVSYANNTVLNVTEATYSIIIKERRVFGDCKYSLKEKVTYENTVLNKNDLNLAIDALSEGRTIITDLSKAKEDAVAYFHYLTGAAFALCADMDRINEDTFMYIPRVISLPEEQNDLKQIKENLKVIDDLFESDNASAEYKQIESLYTECIKTLNKNKYLSPIMLHYSVFLCSIGKIDFAIEQLDCFCKLFLNGNAQCDDLFKKVVEKDFELHMDRGGVAELNAFASEIIEESNTNDKGNNIVFLILNAQAENLINNQESREALKVLKKCSLDITKCDLKIQIDYLFLKALATYKIGLFGKSQRIINDILSKIKSDDCSIKNYIGAKRLQASIYSKKGSYRKAIQIYEELISEIYIKDSKEYRIPYSNDAASLATIYLDNKKFEKAIELYNIAIEYSNDRSIVATYYHNLGVCYVRKNNNGEAKKCFIKALNLRMELSDNPFYDYCEEMSKSLEYLQDISKQNNAK